eukprot:m.12827 g.12827  ORF g.12827 m.12827 type:complete len:262 (+) comp8210_c0_seq2:31-816(+)
MFGSRVLGSLLRRSTAQSLRQLATSRPTACATQPNLQDVLNNNKKWVAAMKAEDPTFFDKLGAGQSPKYLWIGCADSRVPANQILGLPAGSVFVHRNVANLVVNQELSFLSVLEFAVQHLRVEHIMVCGHYDCGGVRAAMSNKDMGPELESWIMKVRDVYRMHQDELMAIDDYEARHRRLVELNVIEQCLNIFKCRVVQRNRVESIQNGADFARPRIHALVFNPGDGILKKLPVDFQKFLKENAEVYGLYNLKDPSLQPGN